MQSSRWLLDRYTGTVSSPNLGASCDVLKPARGLSNLRLGAAAVDDGHILGPGLSVSTTEPERAVQEVFARGSDLAAIYAPCESFPFRSQAYWRLESHPTTANGADAIGAIELVASTQTDLLDSRPDIDVTSYLPVESAWQLADAETNSFAPIELGGTRSFQRPEAAGCFVFRLPQLPYSYAEMVYPLDFASSDLEFSARNGCSFVRTLHHLFAHRLEKGVVLRARVLGLWLRREDDLRVAASHFQLYSHSEPPLTA
jgi:hypothetical protein